MSKNLKTIKKRKSLFLLVIVVLVVTVVLVDLTLFEYKWRPEIRTSLLIYSLTAHFLAVGSIIYLIFYVRTYIGHKFLKICVIVGLVLSMLSLLILALAVFLLTKKPEKTLKPEGYDHIYYLYPKSGYFKRSGYGVYVPNSDYTMTYYKGDFAMNFDTAYISNNTYYIKFNGMDRLFSPESDHLYTFDLSKPQY